MLSQTTLKDAFSLTGVGVHSGQTIGLSIHPAEANTGIIFRRTDLDPVVEFPAKSEYVGDTSRCTVLARDGAHLATIEHVMAALAGLQIDNARIDVDGPELPIIDGSARAFVEQILQLGVVSLDAPRKSLKVLLSVEVRDGDKYLRIEPSDQFIVDFTIVYEHPAFSEDAQVFVGEITPESFAKDVAGARTYGFLAEYEYVRKNNLALGASLENTVVFDDHAVINDDGLRYPNECVKHKVLDAIGDLYLLGHPLLGRLTGYKSGHALNNQLVRALLASPSAWKLQ